MLKTYVSPEEQLAVLQIRLGQIEKNLHGRRYHGDPEKQQKIERVKIKDEIAVVKSQLGIRE